MIRLIVAALTGTFGSFIVYGLLAVAGIVAIDLGRLHFWTVPHLEKELTDMTTARDAQIQGRKDDENKRAAAHELDVAKKLAEERQNTQRAVLAQKEGDAKIQTLTDQLGNARSSEQRMRDRVNSLVAAARRPAQAASASSGGSAAEDPAGVLGRLCSESDRRAGILAEYADRLRISAEACVTAWPVNAAPAASAVEGL